MTQPCRMPGCPGHYERERTAQALRFPNTLIVIDDIPADVCDICGDTLYTAEVARRLDRVMRERPATSATVPLYRYEEVDRALPAPLDQNTADAADAR